MTTIKLFKTSFPVAVVASSLIAVIGIVLAVPQTPALEPSRQTTLECTIPTPALEAPCTQTATINPTMI
jgi:hypothetical protein